jgi:hypothetical protein
MTMNGDSPFPINPMAMHVIYAEGNMESVAQTIPTNISKNPRVMENVFIGGYFSFEEIQIYTKLFK